MPETFQALAVLGVAVLPGALYVWSFERLVGPWGVRLADRILRFVEVSAVFHALIAPFTYWFWIDFIQSSRLGNEPLPWALWLVPLLYVGVPIAAGSAIGVATRRGQTWPKIFTGPAPAPRAWDYFFGTRPDGWIRLRLGSGTWLAGAYAVTGDRRAYAAGYPEAQDLYLTQAAEVDEDTGEFIHDADGKPILRDSAILIRWDEVEYLEFIEA